MLNGKGLEFSLGNFVMTNSNLKGLIYFLFFFSFSPNNELFACLRSEINAMQISKIDEKRVSLDSSQINIKPKFPFVSFHKTSN